MVQYKDIEGFPGYRVGDDGSIWSCWAIGGKRQMKESWRQLKGHRQRYGHISVQLGPKGSAVQLYVHRLVLQAFVGPCPPDLVCRHLNGNASDNRLENLCWDTEAQNSADRVTHGSQVRGNDAGRSKLTEDQVRAIVSRHADGESLGAISRSFGITQAAASAIVRGISWNHVTGLPVHPKRETYRLTAQANRRERNRIKNLPI